MSDLSERLRAFRFPRGEGSRYPLHSDDAIKEAEGLLAEAAAALEAADRVKEALVNGAGDLVEAGLRAEARAAAATEALREIAEKGDAARWIPWTSDRRWTGEQCGARAREALASAGAQQEPPPPPEDPAEAGSADLEAAARIAVDRDPRLDWGLLEEMHADDWGPQPGPLDVRGDKT